jgi:hypothetical protein
MRKTGKNNAPNPNVCAVIAEFGGKTRNDFTQPANLALSFPTLWPYLILR